MHLANYYSYQPHNEFYLGPAYACHNREQPQRAANSSDAAVAAVLTLIAPHRPTGHNRCDGYGNGSNPYRSDLCQAHKSFVLPLFSHFSLISGKHRLTQVVVISFLASFLLCTFQWMALKSKAIRSFTPVRLWQQNRVAVRLNLIQFICLPAVHIDGGGIYGRAPREVSGHPGAAVAATGALS